MEHQELFGREILEFYSDSDSEDIDDLLAVASDHFESRKSPTPLRLRATPPTVPEGFAPPKTDDEIARASIPQSTQRDTKYCINTWEEWRKHRQEVSNTHIPPLTTMHVSEISHWLTRFILEARKKSIHPTHYTISW